MNTDPHQQHLLETDHDAIPSGELFVSFSIAMIVVGVIYLVVALLTPVSAWTQASSAIAAALTTAPC